MNTNTNLTENPAFSENDNPWTPAWLRSAEPADRKDRIGLILLFLSAFLAVDFGFFAGMNLGFTVAYAVLFAVSSAYLSMGNGWKCLTKPFPLLCGLLSLALCPIFALRADGTGKFLAFCAICLLFSLYLGGGSGILYRGTRGFRMLYDALRILLGLPFSRLSAPYYGFRAERDGKAKRGKLPGVLLGFAACIPVLCVVVPLLASADDAFAGLTHSALDAAGPLLLHLFLALLLTPFLFGLLYAMRHRQIEAPLPGTDCRRLDSGIVCGFLGTLSAVYLIYLLSQTAYFFSAFSRILPAGYTAADYARKGFFELCILSMINLFFLFCACTTVRKREGADIPRSVKGFGIFLCLFDLMLIGTAVSKMALYIGRFGLTRLRVLTTAFMILMGVLFLCILVRLICRRFPYMAVCLSVCVLLGGTLLYTGVNRLVADYNADAYLTGRLESADLSMLEGLGADAVPALDRLARESGDPHVRNQAQSALRNLSAEIDAPSDIRSYNAACSRARSVLEGYVSVEKDGKNGAAPQWSDDSQ